MKGIGEDYGPGKDDSIKQIGSVDPVGDFKKMVSDRKHDRVNSAISQMREIIDRYIRGSIGGDIYEKGGHRFQSELIADYWCQPDLQRDGDEGWSRLESGIRSGAVCMRFEGRFTADVARVPADQHDERSARGGRLGGGGHGEGHLPRRHHLRPVKAA